MSNSTNTLLKYGNKLYDQRSGLLSLWQEQADNFYNERADFTATRSMGEDFASNLTTSYPILCRRDLGNSFSAMLRPRDTEWFSIKSSYDSNLDNGGKRWLEEMTKRQRRAMYDPVAQFVRATKEGDHDFATFGQCVISVELNARQLALLYRCWHLRDVVWCEGADGQIKEVHRKWKISASELNRLFSGNVSPSVKQRLEKDPYCEIEVRHVVMRPEEYDNQEKRFRTPWVSVYFETDGGFINEEIGVFNRIYTIPRWQTVSGSQYAYSPATVAALPDARLIQQMTLVLLEAGQKAVDPPMVATEEVVRSDLQLYAGGVTWVDSAYDERLGDALRPMTIDSRGIPLGVDMQHDIREMISQAFFLNKINLPPVDGREMTAYETSQRVQQYIRDALPLFEPMETDYNSAICNDSFDLLQRAGVFGSVQDMPQSLKGKNVEFRFESPLHDAIEMQKGQKFIDAKNLLAEAAALDPSATQMVDAQVALRDALDGIGVPSKWVRSEDDMIALGKEAAQKQQIAEIMQNLQTGGASAESVGKGAQALKQVVTQ